MLSAVRLRGWRVVEAASCSEDVKHLWWIPQLGGKTDALPGRTNRTWYQPDMTGTFYGQCAEFCGLFHERMLGRVVVTSEAEYQSFVSAGAAKTLGKAEWQGVCAKCHGMQGQGDYGPALAATPLLTQKATLEDLLPNGSGKMAAGRHNWRDPQTRAPRAAGTGEGDHVASGSEGDACSRDAAEGRGGDCRPGAAAG